MRHSATQASPAIPSAQIPQATLASVLKVVKAAVSGAISDKDLSATSGLSGRHVRYAAEAARVLGLVVYEKRGMTVTELGRRLASVGLASPAAVALLQQAHASSDVLRRVAPELFGRAPVSADHIASLISRYTSLGPSTARHRARMIAQWQRDVVRSTASKTGMWRKVSLRNYRSIKAADIVLAPFSIMVGPNGSGKSNFADALVFLRDLSRDAVAAVETRGGIAGVRRWRPTKPPDVTVDVRAATSEAGLETDYVRHRVVIKSGQKGDWSFKEELIEVFVAGARRSWIERSGDKVAHNGQFQANPVGRNASSAVLFKQYKEFRSLAAITNVRRYRLNPDRMRLPQVSGEQTRLSEDGSNIAVAVRSLREDSASFSELVKAMAQIVPRLQDVYVEPSGRNLSLKFSQRQEQNTAEFYASEMSEGALRALGILVGCMQMLPNELLVMEEPESSLHPGAARLLFDVLEQASRRGAVLVTTHSVDLLEAASDQEILVCEYTGDDTRIGALAVEQREVVKDGLFSLAELVRSEPLRIQDAV